MRPRGAALADPWRLPFFWPKPLDVWFGYHVLLSPWTLILPLIQAVKLCGAMLWWLAASIPVMVAGLAAIAV